ncbi:MAG TPA: hypothetical protein PKV55_06250 [Nitrospira sp.]|nr:hypothetical protein [Nitrospira sp.]MBS0161338.1 hypothetical protein [Nitrospira sp.]MBS0176980.1 hypothetical protein [Nitrospira sp.]MBX3338800.1 hypothetical protein [Nitrospira sp.]MCW5781044.1 hypothetical protein [Nitrospira sp.]
MQARTTIVVSTTNGGPTHQSMPCTRCGGWMVDERCMDIGESLGGYWFWGQRCIQCGDIVDEVILRNRRLPIPSSVLGDDLHRMSASEAMVHAA